MHAISEVGIQTNIHQVIQQPQRVPTPPQIQQIPPAPPLPRPEEIRRAPPKPEPRQPVHEQQRPVLEIKTRTNDHINELTETLSKREGYLLRPIANQGPTTVHINERSSYGDVTMWLQEKGFSPRQGF
ncbi:hypothetical protein WR25_18232 [Diploscapter pachys]|uniref:Uncharacterized protein n=1 Tax=Diploscapter pachys TaxID=2018661 RepID=A0A2A2LEI1_9BILA|nr:hypothetical protein WR25_18232 [Diploscapter pachys]